MLHPKNVFTRLLRFQNASNRIFREAWQAGCHCPAESLEFSLSPTARCSVVPDEKTEGHERSQTTESRRSRMELTEALVSGKRDEIIEITLSGDEDEWSEIAAVLKESDSDLATELGLKIREALRNAGQ